MAPSDAAVVDELVRYRATSQSATVQFKTLKHNSALCPILERQLRRIEDSFLKYRRAAYNVQGIHDQGTDVVFRYEDKSEPRFIGFQIKSYDDLARASYLKELKAQRYEARQEYQDDLEHYYIMLCTDRRRDDAKIAEVKKTFSKDTQVTVVDPEFALSFLGMQQTRMAAIIDALLRSDDYVFREASRLLADLTPTQIAVLLATTDAFLNGRPLLNTRTLSEISFVRDRYSMPGLEDENEETDSSTLESRLAFDLDAMDGNALHLDDGAVQADARVTRALQATMLDAMSRYELQDEELLAYMLQSLAPAATDASLGDLDL